MFNTIKNSTVHELNSCLGIYSCDKNVIKKKNFFSSICEQLDNQQSHTRFTRERRSLFLGEPTNQPYRVTQNGWDFNENIKRFKFYNLKFIPGLLNILILYLHWFDKEKKSMLQYNCRCQKNIFRRLWNLILLG